MTGIRPASFHTVTFAVRSNAQQIHFPMSMKNIIVPTDYSENATHAMHYAAALAQKAHARLVLYHSFPYPVVTDLPPEILQGFIDNTIAEHLERLTEIKQSIEKQYAIEAACIAEVGSIMRDLPTIMEREKGDLAVMGLRGANPVTNILMGSSTTEVLRQGTVPLLIVPGTAAFKSPERILFACDNPLIENPALLRPLKDIAALFGAEIEVYMVDDSVVVHGQPQPPRPSNLEEHFNKIKHVYTFEMAEGVREQILQAIGESKADLLAMIPRHHSVWAYLFDKSDTLSIALQSTVPMLVLAEKSAA